MKNEVFDLSFDEYIKTVDILYVEDEDSIRELLEVRLSKIFGKIHSAPNGEVGLYKFEAYRPKIVLTDISMPIMDGLEMLEKIKILTPNTKVLVTTAHGEQSFLLKSIDIGIDKYILKPINVDDVIKSIKQVCQFLYNEANTLEYQRKLLSVEITSKIKDIFERISEASPHGIVLYEGEKLLYINRALCSILSLQIIESLKANQIHINDLIVDTVEQKTILRLDNGRKKIFTVIKTPIEAENRVIVMYSFNDQTKQEYQNVKLRNYAEILHDILKLKTQETMKINPNLSSVQTVDAHPIKNEHKEVSIQSFLSDDELIALKRSRQQKLDAKEYIIEISDSILDELEELKELEIEMSDILDDMSDSILPDHFMRLGEKFILYYHTIKKLIEFEDLALAIHNFGYSLINLADNGNNHYSKLLILSQNILQDLINWRRTIFTDQSTIDIHYLDSSLMSSCLNVKLICSNCVVNIDNELELF